ncbi:MAG: hypothetical protein AAGG48_22840 [Planctomycetota bacterium]
MSRTCVFLTMEDPEGFFVYDQLTFEPLRELGWNVLEIPWTDSGARWKDFDAVVIRSTWDYQNAPERFMETLNEIEDSGTPLFNPLRICQWNLDKHYLQDLRGRGVPTVPTKWLKCLDEDRLAELFSNGSGSRLVVKPTIGANSDGLFVLDADDAAQCAAAVMEYSTRPLMVQPFIQSITAKGEYSLFYFGGSYSHAILKQPKQGDFRVQEEHGGTIQATTVSESLKQVAALALNAVGETLLYARVDIVILDDGSPAVTELELIEPSLYFSYDDDSPRRFAEALNRTAKHAN